jgi:hypothetical protein
MEGFPNSGLEAYCTVRVDSMGGVIGVPEARRYSKPNHVLRPTALGPTVPWSHPLARISRRDVPIPPRTSRRGANPSHAQKDVSVVRHCDSRGSEVTIGTQRHWRGRGRGRHQGRRPSLESLCLFAFFAGWTEECPPCTRMTALDTPQR